jgi:hypothetical protein
MKSLGLLGTMALLFAATSTSALAQEPAPAAPAPVDTTQAIAGGPLLTTGPTVWGGIGYWGLYGIGASYMIPVANGVLKHPTIRDQFEIEFGVDYLRRSYDYFAGGNYTWNEVVPVVGVAWMVWLKPNLAVYPKADVGYAFGWLSGFDYCKGIAGCSDPSYGGVFVNGSVGVMYNVGSLVLRAELGNELIKGGLGFLY